MKPPVRRPDDVGCGAVTEDLTLPVPDAALPIRVQGPDLAAAAAMPALVVVPSIFGPADDLLHRLGALGDSALVVAPDPFWRTGEGVVPYDDHETAFARLADFDVAACEAEMAAAVSWARERGNGSVAALGICFGGPYVLRLAAQGLVDAIVTWHGSGMEGALDGVEQFAGPVRHHFGSVDPITPPEAVDAVREAFSGHPDAEIVVHDGANHGFTHDGDAFDASAYEAGFESVTQVLDRLR